MQKIDEWVLDERQVAEHIRRYRWIRSDDRTFEEWDTMRRLFGITLDAYIDQKMGYDHE